MSMEVDFSTPLTLKEREYLLERGRYADIERMDNAHGGSTPEELTAGDGTGTVPVSLLSSDQAAARRAKLLAELKQLDEIEGVSQDPDDDELPPYESWKVPELDAELKDRKLPVVGTKEEKVARLYKDDETVNKA